MELELLIELVCERMARDLMVMGVCGMGLLAAAWLLVHFDGQASTGRKSS